MKREVELWALPVRKLFERLKSSEKGLSDSEARRRLDVYGTNEVAEKENREWFDIIISQFKNALILVLIVAALISYFLGQQVNGTVIILMVVMSAVLGFLQEYKTEKVLRELKKYVTARAKVLRNGEITEISTKNIVPGDIVYLNIGDIIPADIRLLHAEDMTTDESSLTGESVPVLKKVKIVADHSLPQYLYNMAFMGTSVASGAGYGIVIATGRSTFFGKTAAYIKQKEPEADFQKGIRKFSNMLVKIIIVMTAFIFLANAVLGKGVFDSFLFAVALAVGITPEVLPVIMTVTLSRGALKMARENVVTKRLASVEDFGNIDTLCCDKTGTLTEGKLSLIKHINNDGKSEDRIFLYGLLCNSVKMARGRKLSGNPIDRAIWDSLKARAMEVELRRYAVVDENEFDFTRKRMSAVIRGAEGNLLIAKGAPESVMKVCSHITIKGQKRLFSKDLLAATMKKVAEYENSGYRVIAVAVKRTKKTKTTKRDEYDLDLLGFLLFLDPPKKTVRAALVTLQKLGVNIKVISGDSPIITRKICDEVGLAIAEGRVVIGEELDGLTDGEFEEYANKYSVFARVTPEQKFKIVSVLNREGHIVGFLGDGINDAPALKAADVGISVETGAGIAKEAADIILLRKSLRVLAHGIEEGRKTFGNITKYILNTISSNYGNMFTVAISSLFMRFIPLLPSQILLNNIISDVPNIAISTDNVDKDFVKKPKRWDIKMISRVMVYFGVISSVYDLVLILPMLFIFGTGTELFRTAWFVESLLTEVVVIFLLRTRLSFFRSRPSKWLVITALLASAFAIIFPYTVTGNLFFEFVGIPVNILVFIVGVTLAYAMTVEIAKRYFFKGFEI